MRRHISILLAATLMAFAGNTWADTSDINHFRNDWNAWYQADNSNIDNCKLFIKFLYHHKSNDDGFRGDEGGAHFSIDGYYLGKGWGDGDYVSPFHWSRDGSNDNDYFKGWTIPSNEGQSFVISTEGPQYSQDHGCWQTHFQYAKMTITPAAKDIGKKLTVHIWGTYWRWGSGWADDDVNDDRIVWTVYDVDPGEYQIDHIDLDSKGKPYVFMERYDGNSARYSTFYLKENDAIIKMRTGCGTNTSRPSLPNDTARVYLYSAFCKYNPQPVILKSYAEAFADNSNLHKSSTGSKLEYYGFPYPSDLQAHYDLESHVVNITWNASKIPAYAQAGKWIIQRTDKTNNVVRRYIVDLKETSYVDQINENTDYTYRIYYSRDSWDRTKIYPDLATDEVSASVVKNVNLQIGIPETLDDRINFTVTFDASRANNFYKLAINRDGIPVRTVSDIQAGQGSVRWSDIYNAQTNPLNVNTPHTYQFVIYRTRPQTSELQSVEAIAAASGATHISSFTATRGVKTDDVQLRWKSERDYSATYTDRFRIERRLCSAKDEDYKVVTGAEDISSTTIDNSFTDKTCNPGEMYMYRLRILSGDRWADVGRAMGYVISTGSISGRITYASGNGGSSNIAAAGVEMRLTPLNASNTTEQAFPMRCRQMGSANDPIKIALSQTDQNLLNKAYTYAFWRKDNTTSNRWLHYAFTTDSDGQKIMIVSDADSILSVMNKELTFGDTLYLCGDSSYFDEIQLWSVNLSKEEVMKYRLRHLSGEEDGLLAYLPLDESFNYGYSFDMAMNGSQSRGHHAKLSLSMKVSTLAAPVSFCTETDANGNYSIKGLPFGENGNDVIYRVMPVYGAHVFSPTTQNILLTTGSRTFMERDFTDETSVSVSGLVHYRYGNFPVSGATVLVDDKPVNQSVIRSGVATTEKVTTDAQGKYSIVIPCGEHKISVELKGHTFTTSSYTVAGTANVKDLNFEDNTLMKLWGRVAGGSVECSKKLPSFNAADANIGQATLYLRPTSNLGYTFNNTGKDVEMAKGHTDINSSTILRAYTPLMNADTTIVIKTDSLTGEFCALLPPISYTITRGFTASVPNDSLRAFDMPEINPTLRGDSVFTDTCIVRYDSKPTFVLIDASHPSSLALGMDSVKVGGNGFALYTVKRKDNPNLFTDEITYTLGHPVWQAGTRQCMMIYLQQRFYNAARQKWTSQALPKGTQISFNACNINTDENRAENVVTLDEQGYGTYFFTVREPNRADAGKASLQAAYTLNNRTYTYPDSPIEMILLGENVSEGSGFITTAPDQIDFVLHRPPGTNSSATLHKGTTIVSKSTVDSSNSNSHITNQAATGGIGANWKTGWFKNSFRIQVTDKTSLTNQNTKTTSQSVFHTGIVSEDITTGSGANVVGANGNIFIGHGNAKMVGRGYIYGFTDQLPAKYDTEPVTLTNKDGKKCYLVGYEGDFVGMTADHQVGFAYTRYYIVNTLIPEVRKLRDSKILAMGSDTTTFTGDEFVKYISTVPASDSNFGNEGSYKRVLKPGATKEQQLQNEVLACNNWIASWKQALADDEMECINASCNNIHTISSGGSYSSAINTSMASTSLRTTGYSFTNTKSNGFSINGEAVHSAVKDDWSHWRNDKIRTDVEEQLNKSVSASDQIAARRYSATAGGGANLDMSWVSTDIEKTAQTISGTTTLSTNLSYTIKDNDPYDYLTVAVSDSADAGRMFYRIQGGATTNPWEGGEKSQYYNPGMVMSNATLMVERPVIKLEKSELNDVPSGHTATLNLSITNGSEVNAPQYYYVGLISSSNEKGLVVAMDGRPLAQGTVPVWLEAGQTVTKVLTISQSSLDEMDYDQVQIYVSGKDLQTFEMSNEKLCPKAPFSIHYKPSCSDISMAMTDNSGININTVNQVTGDTVRFALSGYDLSYKGFQKIQLQRYDRSLQRWQPIHQWYLDSNEARQYDADSVCGRSTLYFDYNMHALADDTYKMRAVTIGRYGTDEVQYEAPAQEIVKDVTAPRSLGTPSPISGTLTTEDEISITFNEDIYKERIVDANISVTGELNHQPVLHNTGLNFTGSAPVVSSVPMTITRSGSSIEMWLQREMGKEGTVFAHGTNASRFAFGFDAEDHLWVTVAGKKYTSETAIKTNQWQFLHVGFNNGRVSAACMWNDQSGTAYSKWVLQPEDSLNYNTRALCRFGENFNGRLSQITMWNSPRTDLTEIAASKDKTHSPGETGLQNYWPCTECHGKLASDRIAERSLSLPTESYWYISQANHSAYFDGQDSLIIKNDTINLGEMLDYTIEMWVRPDKSTIAAQQLITTSIGDLSLADGCLALGGIKVSTTNLRDEQWHHLAMSLLYGKSVTFMVDGNVTMTVDVDSVGKYVMAQGLPFDYTPEKYVVGKNYKGYMDEFRLWASNVSLDVIRMGMYQRMTGREKGLAVLSNMEDADYFKGYTHIRQSEVAPSLQPSRTEQSVQHTWTASDRKIVITPTEQASLIEGCTLRFTVDRIADVHGNDILCPITWSALIRRTTLELSGNVFDIRKTEASSAGEMLCIYNNGNVNDVVSLTNVPSWLTISDNNFSLEPFKSKNLTLEVPEDIPTGEYTATLQVTSQATGISQSIVVSLTVSSEKPEWNVDSRSYNSSCNVLATCRKDGNLSEDASDEIVAYVLKDNGEPIYIGKAENTYLTGIQSYRFLLNIYFDAESASKGYTGALTMKKDRTIHYLYWDDSVGLVYTDIKLYDASGNQINLTLDNMENFRVYGTPLSPYEFQVQNTVQQTLSYGQGWNWVSLNTRTEDEAFTDYFPTDGKLQTVKTQTNYAQLSNNKTWIGDLPSSASKYFRNMYMALATESHTHIYEGTPLIPSKTSYQIHMGWNWLPYYPTMRMPVGYALRDVAFAGDIVKGQDGFAYRTENGWVGTLTNLMPGHGYMYYATQNINFSYPDDYIPTSNAREKAASAATEHQYQMNMCAIIAPLDAYDTPLTEGTITSYDPQGNLRGTATVGNAKGEAATDIDTPISFITIAGDQSTEITLQLVTSGGMIYTSQSTLPYVSNTMLGTPAEPLKVRFTLTGQTGINGVNAGASTNADAYDLTGRHATDASRGVIISNGEKKINRNK